MTTSLACVDDDREELLDEDISISLSFTNPTPDGRTLTDRLVKIFSSGDDTGEYSSLKTLDVFLRGDFLATAESSMGSADGTWITLGLEPLD